MTVREISFFIKHQLNDHTTKKQLLNLSVVFSVIVALSGAFALFGLTPVDFQPINTISHKLTYWGCVAIFAIGGGWILVNTHFARKLYDRDPINLCENEKNLNHVKEHVKRSGITDALEDTPSFRWNFTIPANQQFPMMYGFIIKTHTHPDLLYFASTSEKVRTAYLQRWLKIPQASDILEARQETLISDLSKENQQIIQEHAYRLAYPLYEHLMVEENRKQYRVLLEMQQSNKCRIRITATHRFSPAKGLINVKHVREEIEETISIETKEKNGWTIYYLSWNVMLDKIESGHEIRSGRKVFFTEKSILDYMDKYPKIFERFRGKIQELPNWK